MRFFLRTNKNCERVAVFIEGEKNLLSYYKIMNDETDIMREGDWEYMKSCVLRKVFIEISRFKARKILGKAFWKIKK